MAKKKDDSKKTKKRTPEYAKEDLVEAAKNVFNVRPHVLAGALNNVEAGTMITEKEAKKKLDKFLDKTVEKTRNKGGNS